MPQLPVGVGRAQPTAAATVTVIGVGGCDGQLRLWDIRRAGPLHIFDQHQTQPAPRPRPPEPLRNSRGAGAGRSSSSTLRDRGGGLKSFSKGTNNGSSGGGSKRGAGALAGGRSSTGVGAAGRGAPSERDRMFLPDKVTRYATAHGGSITGVLPSPHGLYWLSAGTDDRVRLWDALDYRWEGRGSSF